MSHLLELKLEPATPAATITPSLDKVSMLEGVSFDWKTNEYAARGLSDDKQIGLIAQDEEKVLPELVRTGTDGYKAAS